MLVANKFLISVLPTNVKIVVTKQFIIIISSIGLIFFKYQNIIWDFQAFKVYMLKNYVREMSGIKSLLNTAVLTCCTGIFVNMYLKGVGFRCWCENSTLFLKLGFSNIIQISLPVNIYVNCISKTELRVYGLQLQTVYNFCMLVKRCRRNNIYKQIGIYFSNEIIVLRKLKTKKESFN